MKAGRLGAGVLAAAMLAGCGAVSNHALNASLKAIATPQAKEPKPHPDPVVKCPNMTASLRPAATLPAPGHMPPGTEMAAIQRRGHLIAGVDQNSLLFAYRNPSTGSLEGFEIDLLRQIAKAIFGNPHAIEFKAITTGQRKSVLQQHEVDLVADAYTITCARKQQVAFSTVYFDAKQRLLVDKGASADIAGKRVCATLGSTSLDTLKNLPSKPIPDPVAQRTDCLVALQEGRVAAITSDDALLLGLKIQDPNTKIVGRRLADEPYGIAMAQGHPEFVRFVNGVLARIRADREWAAIYRKWLGRFTPTPKPPTARYVG